MNDGLSFTLQPGILLIDFIRENDKFAATAFVKEEFSEEGAIRRAADVVVFNLPEAGWLSWPSAAIVVDDAVSECRVALSCPPDSADEVGVVRHLHSKQLTLAMRRIEAVLRAGGHVSLNARKVTRGEGEGGDITWKIDARVSDNTDFPIEIAVQKSKEGKLPIATRLIAIERKAGQELDDLILTVRPDPDIEPPDFALIGWVPGMRELFLVFFGKARESKIGADDALRRLIGQEEPLREP